MALKESFKGRREFVEKIDTAVPMEIRYLTKDEKADLRTLFQKHDKYGEGRILVQDAKNELKERGMKPKDPQIKQWLEENSTTNSSKKGTKGARHNADDYITINDLETIIRTDISTVEYEEAQMLAQFRKFDLDGNGKITKDELITILKSTGKTDEEAEEEAHSLINEADENGDEEIEYEEFKQIFGMD